jgi:hypothetical protein
MDYWYILSQEYLEFRYDMNVTNYSSTTTGARRGCWASLLREDNGPPPAKLDRRRNNGYIETMIELQNFKYCAVANREISERSTSG